MDYIQVFQVLPMMVCPIRPYISNWLDVVFSASPGQAIHQICLHYTS